MSKSIIKTTITVNDLALALVGVQHAQTWWAKGKSRSQFVRRRKDELDILNLKLSHILDACTLPEDRYGEIPDNGLDKITLTWKKDGRRK